MDSPNSSKANRKKGPGRPGPFCLCDVSVRSVLGEPDLDEPFAPLTFDKKQDACPAGLKRLGNGFRKIGGVFNAALAESLDDVTRLQSLAGGCPPLDHLGNDNAAGAGIKAKFCSKLGIEIVHGKSELLEAFRIALAFLADDPDQRTSPLGCDASFELTAGAVRDACDADGVYQRFVSGTSLVPTFTGPFVTTATFSQGGVDQHYLVVFEPEGGGVLGCTALDSDSTNEIAAEPVDATTTALYVATGTAVVKATFDDATDALRTAWSRAVPIRARTGTTPTLVDTHDGERFVVLVDGRCAVSNVLNGLIVCDDDPAPSRLVAVRRDDDLGARDPVLTTDLPAWLTTTENSPAARGDRIVVANYSGYVPNGLQVPAGAPRPDGGPGTWQLSPDAEAVFSTGFTVLSWRSGEGRFAIDWSEPERQASGVPLVSAGANVVYTTGAERDSGGTFVYGHRLADAEAGPAGAEVLRVRVGDAPFRATEVDGDGNVIIAREDYALRGGELYDAGNNLFLGPDRSLFMTGGAGIVRITTR